MTDLRDTNSSLYIAFNTSFYLPGGTRYNGLDGEAPPKWGAFFRFKALREREREKEVYKREGISQVKVYKRGREIGHLVI